MRQCGVKVKVNAGMEKQCDKPKILTANLTMVSQRLDGRFEVYQTKRTFSGNRLNVNTRNHIKKSEQRSKHSGSEN